jgi:hypothetical protein
MRSPPAEALITASASLNATLAAPWGCSLRQGDSKEAGSISGINASEELGSSANLKADVMTDDLSDSPGISGFDYISLHRSRETQRSGLLSIFISLWEYEATSRLTITLSKDIVEVIELVEESLLPKIVSTNEVL